MPKAELQLHINGSLRLEITLSEEDGGDDDRTTMRNLSQEARDAAFATAMEEVALKSFDRLAERVRTMASRPLRAHSSSRSSSGCSTPRFSSARSDREQARC